MVEWPQKFGEELQKLGAEVAANFPLNYYCQGSKQPLALTSEF